MYVISKIKKQPYVPKINSVIPKKYEYAITIFDYLRPTKAITITVPEEKFDDKLFYRGRPIDLTLAQKIRMYFS